MKPSFRQDDSLDSAGSTSSFSGNQQGYSEELPGFEQMTFERNNPTNSVSSVSSYDQAWEGRTGPLMSQESVYQLTKDLRSFSEALTALKAVFLGDRNVQDRGLRVLAHERLGELLQVLKMVVDKYSELNSGEILAMAGVLIKHVKEFSYEDEDNDVSPEVFRAINNLAMIFSNSVSECLLGETDISPNTAAQPFDLGGSKPIGDSDDATHLTDASVEGASTPTEITTSYVESADELLHQMETGLDKAFDRAKILSKYLGELVTFVKKKSHLEMEHSKGLQKLAQSTKTVLSEQSFLPFQSLYCTALDHDREYASSCHSMYQISLLQQKFIEPLQAKKNEHDKRRKTIRETWSREKKHCEESVANMRKAKATYQSRVAEHQKAKEAAIKAEGEIPSQSQTLKTSGSGTTLGSVLLSTTTKMDKKKKQEEDSNVKAASAELAYRASVAEANKRLRDLDKSKAMYLQQLRELMLQCDQTAKSVTVSYFQLHHRLFAPLPIQFQAMCEDAKRYEPGFQYSDYIRNLPTQQHKPRTGFHFESYGAEGASYLVQPDGKTPYSDEVTPHPPRRHRSGHKGLSDTESSSSRSLDDISPSASPGAPVRPADARRHSTEGSLSSEEILEEGGKDGKAAVNLGLPVDPTPETSPVPTRSFTKNAFKMAANVREAFIKGKKTKSTLFGVDLATAGQSSPDGIPFLVKRCIAEIDNRALSTKGIYRVNGVKNRVEKLCAQFDIAAERVDLSQHSPHDIGAALKYFLRQLPKPLLQFHLYDAFLDIAKDYQQLITSTNEAANQAKEEGLPVPSLPSKATMNSFVERMRDTVEQLPSENRNTLQYLVSHLTRVAYHSHDNKMTPSNLAIVFGPNLLRPVLTDGNESLKTLIDMPYQSRVIEMLIVHKDTIFGTLTHQAGNIFPFSGFQLTQPSCPPDKPDPDEAAAAAPSEEPSKDEISHQDEVLLSFDDDTSANPTNLNNNPPNPNDNNSSYHSNGYLQSCLSDSGALVPNSFGLTECDAPDKSSFHRPLRNDVLMATTDKHGVHSSPRDANYFHQSHTLPLKKSVKSSGDAEFNDVTSNFDAPVLAPIKTAPADNRKRRTSLTQIGKSMGNDLKRLFPREQKTTSLDRKAGYSSATSMVGHTPPRPATAHHPQCFKLVESGSREEEASSC